MTNHPPSLVRVVAALKDSGAEITAHGDYLMANCPAHPDANPSLSVKHDGDRTLLNCFAGCDYDDIVRSLGISPADAFDVRPGEEESAPAASSTSDPTSRLVNWEEAWKNAKTHADWLLWPIVEAGRATSLTAPAGAGKSLMALEIAAGLAAGRNAFGQPLSRTDVLYFDYENDLSLLVARLSNMGYGPADLTRLSYYSFPEAEGLDTKAGGAALVAAAERHRVRLVVVDTYATSVDGEENSADTARGFAKYVVAPLKARSIASLRLDHTGKQVSLGERGSSAKRGDIDYAWLVTKNSENAFTFKNVKNRPGHAPEEFQVERKDEPYLHHDISDDLLAQIDPVPRIVAEMDRLGLPLDLSRDAARSAGITGKNGHISEAIKQRKERESNG